MDLSKIPLYVVKDCQKSVSRELDNMGYYQDSELLSSMRPEDVIKMMKCLRDGMIKILGEELVNHILSSPELCIQLANELRKGK